MIVIEAPAKLNLGLKVLGQRSDGFHELDTVFVSINLFDTLELKPLNDGIIIECNHPAVPLDERNLVWQAIIRLQNAYSISDGVQVKIQKRIPVGGGLAGGSSDAAAVLRALPLLWNIQVDDEVMRSIANQLGADVYYCYCGGTQRGRDIGTELQPIANNCVLTLAILPQPWSISTAAVFKAYHQIPKQPDFSIDQVVAALAHGDRLQLCESLENSLMLSAFLVEPRLAGVYKSLDQAGFFVQMTGSGSTLYVILPDYTEFVRLKAIYPGEIIVCSILNALPSAIMNNK